MSVVLYVYAGPCIRVYPNGAGQYNFKAIDEYSIHDTDLDRTLTFGRVTTGNSEDKIYLIPNTDQNRPNRCCEWEPHDDVEPVNNPDVVAELTAFQATLTELPDFAHEVVWAIVPYFY